MIDRIAILGAGKSGLEVAKWAVAHGIQCVMSDTKPTGQWPDLVVEWCEAHGVEMDPGGHSFEVVLSSHMIVPSPGVPLDIPILEEARARKIPIIGELALALSLWNGPKIGITGTNGKTTCTTMVGEMLKASDIEALVGGNIGAPLLSQTKRSGVLGCVLVAEVSSFQLDLFPTIEDWRIIEPFLARIGDVTPTYPHFDVAVLLNISQDHLERYGGLDQYARSKAKIFCQQPQNGWAIVEEEALKLVEAHGQAPRARRILIRPETRLGRLFISWPEGGEESYDLSGFRPIGLHNLKNLSAAIYCARICGARASRIQDVIRTFKPLAHRLEFVAKKGDIVFIDDSKATNLDAMLVAIEAVDAPVILICGGVPKGQHFEGLDSPSVRRRLRGVVFLGKAVPGMSKALSGVPGVHVNGDGNGWDKMQEAVEAAYDMASPGDVVLLSPACASFDLFSGYSERGNAFKAAVKRLVAGGGARP